MSSVSRGPRLVELDEVGEVLAADEALGTTAANLKPLSCRAPQTISVAGDACPFGPLTIEAGSEVSLFVFNNQADRDPDAVLAPPGTGQLEPSPGACWLVVRHRAHELREKDPAADHAEAHVPVVCSDYRRHENSENAARAVIDGLREPRLAHRLEDVRALRPGDAVAFTTSGRLTTALDVRWSDVFASGLGTVAGIVGGASPLAVRLPAAAKVGGTVRLDAPFSVVFARLQNGRTRVAVKKAGGWRGRAPAEPGMAVELGDPGEIEAALHDVVSGVLGQSYVTVRTLVDRPAPAELTAEEVAAAEALSRHLDVGAGDGTLRELQEKLRQLEGVIGEALTDLATGKLADGLAYEFARLPRGALLLQAILDPVALERFHAPLCRGNLVPLVTALAEGAPGIALESYLQRRTLERSRCWGFTLGIGSWASRGRQRRTLTKVDDSDLPGAPRVSCLGLGAYEGRWLADLVDWTADFRADMPHPARGAAPLAREFELGLHLAWHSRHARLEADGLEAVVDMALLWGVIPGTQADAVRQRLAGVLGRAAEVTFQLRFDDVPFRALLPVVAAGRNADFAAALGAAMPWRKGSPGRADPMQRRDLYGPLWAHALEQPDAPARALVALARQRLAEAAETQLGFLEENYLRLTPTSTFVGLARVANQSTAAAWEDCRSAARVLHGALAAGASEDGTFERVFALMANLWAQAHHVRALGVYLVEAAAQANVTGAVARTLTVVAGDTGSETALVVAAPAA